MGPVSRSGVVAALTSTVLAALVAPAYATTDTTAPVVTVTATPGAVDVTTGEQQVQVTAVGTDETALKYTGVVMDESRYYDNGWHTAKALPGVTTATHSWTYTVPPGARAGTWTVRATATDVAGNRAEVTTSVELAAGARDWAPPTTTCTSTPTAVDTTWGPAAVKGSVRLDDPAGVVPLPPVTGYPGLSRWDELPAGFTWTTPIGTTFSGTATGSLPQGAPIGANELTFNAADRLNNQRGAKCLLATNTGSRIAGANRYATAAQAARLETTTGGTVYVVTGESFADAASATAAPDATAGLLYTAVTALPPETRAALTRLKPAKIVVVGSAGVVSTAVESALRSYAPTVVRRSGPDRYATSAALASGNPRGGTVYLVTGASYPNVVAVAANKPARATVLLADPAHLSASTASALAALDPSRVVLVGSGWAPGYTTAVSKAAAAPVSPLAAPDRYQLAATLYPQTPLPLAFVAAGDNWPDALAVASHRDGRTVYLSTPTSLPWPTLEALRTDGPTNGIIVIGSSPVLADAVQRSAVLNG